MPRKMYWDEKGDMMEDESELGDGGDGMGGLEEGAGGGITM